MAAPAASAAAHTAGLKVLAVDDCSFMRELVGCALGRIGIEVTKARDGADALRLAQAQRYDAVLADLNMPQVDGLALIRALRALPQYRRTPILMMTGAAEQEQRRAGKAAGATGWLAKPFTPEQLLAAIRRSLP